MNKMSKAYFQPFDRVHRDTFHTFKSHPSCKVYKSTLCMPQSSNGKQKNSCEEVEAAWERFQQAWQILFSGWQCCIKAYVWCYSLLRPTDKDR